MVANVRVVFFGTPQFAVPSLEHLIEFAAPGRWAWSPNPTARADADRRSPTLRSRRLPSQHGLPSTSRRGYVMPEVEDRLRSWAPDLGVVAAYGKIIPESLLNLPRLGMINVHASLLPRYRGAAPVQRAVIDGVPQTGVTIMRMVAALDAGGMFAKVTRPIGPDETSDVVERDLAELGASLLLDVIDDLVAGTAVEEPQDDRLSTYAREGHERRRARRLERPALDIHNRIRGLYPWPHAYTYLDNERLILLRSHVDSPATRRAARHDRRCLEWSSPRGHRRLGAACNRGSATGGPARDEDARLPGGPPDSTRGPVHRSMTAPARTAAFHALVAIASNHRDLPTALVESRRRLEDERDRSLAAAIVHGTLRWQRACDYLIERVSARSLASLDQDVLVILRLSLYQILHLDRVPSAAVVDDAVSLTRAAGKKSATGFVNAVLRSTLRQRHTLPLPGRPDDPAHRDAALLYLGITLSHPEWLVVRWLDRCRVRGRRDGRSSTTSRHP